MAAVTHAVGTADTGNTPNTSGAFTPVTGDLLVCFVIVSDTTTAISAFTSSIGAITFTQFLRAVYRTSLDSVYGFISNNLITAAQAISQTVTASPAVTGTGSIIYVCRVSGMKRTGLNAVRQFAKQDNQAASTPAPAFSLACLTENVTLGAIGNNTNPPTFTPPTSWTEGTADLGYATPATGAEYVFRNSGFTGTTVTWGSASGSTFASMIVELNTSEKDPYKPGMQASPILAQ